MSNSDRSKSRLPEVPVVSSDFGSGDAACQAGELKNLLNIIVTQISEADRRHSDTLSQMQDRLQSMGQDARVLRSRVPGQFQAAFERIEAGMAELASRIAEVNGPAMVTSPVQTPAAPPLHDPPAPTPGEVPASAANTTGHAHQIPEEAPAALRSATSSSPERRWDEPLNRTNTSGVDTFDVIESLPGDVSDPWDRDAADALAHVYGELSPTGAASYASPAVAESSRPACDPAPTVLPLASPVVAQSTFDHDWLEKRFSEISQRIEASLAEIRPEETFFALGQRLDQVERGFAQAFDNVATRDDVEALRLIEAHMSEIVGHLEAAHTQISRLDTIEGHLSEISDRLTTLEPLPGAPHMPMRAEPEIDIAAVARAAAEETAAQFSQLAKNPQTVDGFYELRDLVERSIADARQSEDNTAALLDTLQQAMIRLLDRMDAIELARHQQDALHQGHRDVPQFGFEVTAEPQQVPHRGRPEVHAEEMHSRSVEMPVRVNTMDNDSVRGRLVADEDDADVAPPPKRAQPSPFEHVPRAADMRSNGAARIAQAEMPEERNTEKVRQDFIAEARRAKLRIASEAENGEVVITNAAVAPAIEDLPPSQRPAGKVKRQPTANDRSFLKSVPPRTIALALALVLAGGGWLLLSGKGKLRDNAQAVPSAAAVPAELNANATAKRPDAQNGEWKPGPPKTGEAKAGSADKVSKNAVPDTAGAPPPDANFEQPAEEGPTPKTEPNRHKTEGRIMPDVSPGSTAALPLAGIAIATDHNATTADLVRARQHEAMASVSNTLGRAAGEAASAFTTPVSRAALTPRVEEPAAAGAPETSSLKLSGGQLDLPPASVGPLSLRLAAANGDPSAEFEVGARLAEGKGTDQNFKDAAKWYQRSASKSFAQSQYRLGTLYERGLGLKADEERAKDWYRRAAEQGNIKAMHNLAVLSANAHSGAPDYATAATWFENAAEHGLADSQFNLAVLYENGLGVDADLKQAYKWLAIAAAKGDKEAVRRRDILKGKLTGDEVKKAEEMVQSFKPQMANPLANDARVAGEAWKKNSLNGQDG